MYRYVYIYLFFIVRHVSNIAKSNYSFIMLVHLSVYMEQLDSHWMDFV